MSQNIKQFEVSSPDELLDTLSGYKQNGVCFAGVRVFGPNILTRQFNFPKSSAQDLVSGLTLEASETLSVAASDLEVSYMVTGEDEQGMHGIYSVMPRGLLMKYLECFKDHPLVPVFLTASAVGAVIDFQKDHALLGGNFCLVNFLNSRVVNIIIFVNARPTFFREFYDLSDNDFKDKVTDTIRYSCSQSASKSIDQVFFTGDLTGKDALMKSLKELKNFSLKQPVSPGDLERVDLTGLNLFGNFVCEAAERERLVLIFSLVSVILTILSIFLVWHFVNGYIKLHDASLRLNMGDYNRALDLQEQVRRLNHG